MSQIVPELWQPRDIQLERAADEAVREISRNSVVVAGPGSGKTELLAQKACFLLETRTCPPPFRILAVSFKRDAARNLKDRVILRSGRELAQRFDSLTFDAFSKGLLDRFRGAVPAEFRPSRDYSIDYSIQRAAEMRLLLDHLPPAEGLTFAQVQELSERNFERRYLCGRPLDQAALEGSEIGHRAARALWRFLLHEEAPSRITFTMISRIVDLLLRTNRQLLAALRQTYRFVFLDEFQDTTDLQYTLICTCFQDTNANLTAVGDNKQRIMGWAGALDEIFATYQDDFNAVERRLLFNFRSAPRLVQIQHAIVVALEGQEVTPSVSKVLHEGEGECSVLSFHDHEREAEYLSEQIAGWMSRENLAPRDICILTRQLVEQYSDVLVQALAQQGVKGRVESQLQDLLAEPVTTLVLNMLRLLVEQRSAAAWEETIELLVRMRGCDSDEAERSSQQELAAFISNSRDLELHELKSEIDLHVLVDRIIEFFGKNRVTAMYSQYKQGAYLKDLIDSVVSQLTIYRQQHDWTEALDHFEGKTSIPIMTVHKSKGLEYHTVVFVGLEDSALWGFPSNPQEETCTFFVAFSRAKHRVVFTVCDRRPGRRGIQLQTTENIEPLYSLLDVVGVQRISIT